MQFTRFAFMFLGVFLLLGAVFASNGFEGAGEQFKEKQKLLKENMKEQEKLLKENYKEKMEKLRENYKDRLESYKEMKEKWQEKNKDLGLGFMLDSNEGRKATVNYLDVLGAKVQEHLDKIKDKGPFAEYMDAKVEAINAVIANLDENSSKEEIKEAVKEIKQIWKGSEHKRKIAIAEKYLEGVDKVIPKMENALNKLDTKLDTVEAAGIDSNTARAQYLKAQESVANLKLQITATEEKLNALKDENTVDVNSVNKIVKELNTEIHSTRKEIVKALVEFNKLKSDYAKVKTDDDSNKPKVKDQNKVEDENELEIEDDEEDDSNNLNDSNELEIEDDDQNTSDDSNSINDDSNSLTDDDSEDDSNSEDETETENEEDEDSNQ